MPRLNSNGGNQVHAGELNRLVELFSETYVKGSTSERVRTEVSKGKKFAKRVEGTGEEDEDGRLIPVKVASFVIRFDRAILDNGAEWFIRDIDGDFHIKHIAITGPGRNRFLELKCRSRG